MAPASFGADAHTDHKSATGASHERRQALEKKLWSERGRAEFEKLSLAFWASRRRQELLELSDRINPTTEELTAAVEQDARKRPEVLLLMTHPGAPERAVVVDAESKENDEDHSQGERRGLFKKGFGGADIVRDTYMYVFPVSRALRLLKCRIWYCLRDLTAIYLTLELDGGWTEICNSTSLFHLARFICPFDPYGRGWIRHQDFTLAASGIGFGQSLG